MSSVGIASGFRGNRRGTLQPRFIPAAMDRIWKDTDGACGIVLADAGADHDVIPNSEFSGVRPKQGVSFGPGTLCLGGVSYEQAVKVGERRVRKRWRTATRDRET